MLPFIKIIIYGNEWKSMFSHYYIRGFHFKIVVDKIEKKIKNIMKDLCRISITESGIIEKHVKK